MLSHRIFLCLTLVPFVFVGCEPDGPEIAEVEGTITMDGKPLTNAAIMFAPDNGRPAVATTDEQGHYVLNFTEGREGAIPGTNRITITTERDANVDDDGKSIPGSPETIPVKYNAESTLEFNVEPGKKNIADFQLTSK